MGCECPQPDTRDNNDFTEATLIFEDGKLVAILGPNDERYSKINYWAPVWNNSFDKKLVWVQIGGEGGYEEMDEEYDDAW